MSIKEILTRLINTVKTLGDRDYIEEQGTSGIWTYRKWSSGIAECWGKHVTTVSSWGAWGSSLVETTGSSATETFPSGLFKETPMIMVTPPQAPNGAFVETTGEGSATSTPNIYIVRPSAVSGTKVFSVPVYAKGVWK